MKKYFTISEAAKAVGLTAETLRHYDRTGLVKPSKVDEWTGYRYYSPNEIVLLNTVQALRCMDLSLAEIKRILSYDDFGKIAEALKQAEKNADEKIARLHFAKEKIRRARAYYENRPRNAESETGTFIRYFPQRVIMLSQLHAPTADNLWNYHRHFYELLPENMKSDFSFEDLAGIYSCNGESRLFAVCTRYRQTEGLKILPKGEYLCVNCTEETRIQATDELIRTVQERCGVRPSFSLQLIVVSGILQWNYMAQVLIPESAEQ